MKIVTVTDPQHADQSVSLDLRSSALLLLDLDGEVITTLTDHGSASTHITDTCARRVWAARLRYWAEQFEKETS